jgi:hypothetical protein
MYELLGSDAEGELMVFRDGLEALDWLGTRAPSGWHDISVLSPDWLFETG